MKELLKNGDSTDNVEAYLSASFLTWFKIQKHDWYARNRRFRAIRNLTGREPIIARFPAEVTVEGGKAMIVINEMRFSADESSMDRIEEELERCAYQW